jgi:hypothetical protein
VIWQPKPGQRVQINYAKDKAAKMPLHGKIGVVIAAGKGKKVVNVAARIDDDVIVVPRGNLRTPTDG